MAIFLHGLIPAIGLGGFVCLSVGLPAYFLNR